MLLSSAPIDDNIIECEETNDYTYKQPEPIRTALQLGEEIFAKRMQRMSQVSYNAYSYVKFIAMYVLLLLETETPEKHKIQQ